MAWVAEHEPLKSSTIDTYSSAVSTWHRQATLTDGPSLGESTAVSLVRAGIHKTRRPAENRDKARDDTRPDPLNRDVIDAIVAAAPGTGPRECMIIAAAHVGVEGLLRPNELLGAHADRKEALTVDQLTFWADAERTTKVSLQKDLGAAGPIALHHVDIDLGATKADPEGINPPLAISYQPAVRALWNWLHLRQSLHPPRHVRSVFVRQTTQRWSHLSIPQFFGQLSEWGRLAGLTQTNFRGKSMRQGQAAWLLTRGASGPELLAAGRWRTPSMPLLYAGSAAVRARQLHLAMGTTPAPPAAGL